MWIRNLGSGLFTALFGLALAGCSKELGRVPFATEATGDTRVQLAPGTVDFWTDLSVVYLGAPSISYQIDLEQGGALVASTVCDPLGPKPIEIGWEEYGKGPYHRVKGRARMSCSVVVPKGGPTDVRVTLAYDATAKTVALTKGDLVVEQ